MNRSNVFIRLALPFLLIAAALLCTACSSATVPETFTLSELTAENSDLDSKLSSLKKAMLADFGGSNLYKSLEVEPSDGRYTVFISASDASSRAKVFSANGDSISDAFENAASPARTYVNENDCAPVWVKADLVTSSENVAATRLSGLISKCADHAFKWGISFDKDYKSAFLEAQINAGSMVIKSSGTLSSTAVNSALEADGKERIESLPSSIVFFYCSGYICDEQNTVYALCGDIDDGYGKRVTGRITPVYATSIIDSASSYLAHEVGENGKFVYGRYASSYTEVEGYNSVRHAGTVWNMIRDYELAPDEELKASIGRAIGYMIDSYCRDIGNGAALYLRDDGETLTVGGTALSLLALADYTRVFEDDRYLENARALANGIVYLHSASDGGYVHIVGYPGLDVVTEFSSVFFDGEATLALAAMYRVDRDEKWLSTASEALHHFAANGYEEYADHWIAYACNEVTKYDEQADFYELGLKNVSAAMEKEMDAASIHPTGFEMLTASFELCMRLESSPVKAQVSVPEGFSVKRLAQIILYRAEYNLCGFAYPEYAMYFSSPSSVVGTFFTRESNYRIRIDDVQHILGGYYNYCGIYDQLVKTVK